MVSVEEYLRQEEQSRERHEYLRGEIFAMAGGTPSHSRIGGNLYFELRLALRNRDCSVWNGDMRLRTDPSGLYSYADVAISCGEQFEGNTLLNPIMIGEVLSESTVSYDRGMKFEEYRRIPSFQEYLVVAPDRPYVEHHLREESKGVVSWLMQQHTSLDDVLTLKSLGVSIQLTGIYNDVVFARKSK